MPTANLGGNKDIWHLLKYHQWSQSDSTEEFYIIRDDVNSVLNSFQHDITVELVYKR